jgi:hypothetical protein
MIHISQPHVMSYDYSQRTSLLEDEHRLIACQHGNADISSLPKDLQVRTVGGIHCWVAI